MSIALRPLSEYLDSLETGKRPTGGAVESGVPSLGGEHLNADGTFKLDSMKYVPEDFFRTIRKGLIQQDDILVVKDGATTGKTAYVAESFPFKEAAINEHLFLLRANPEKAYSKFLYYLLRSKHGNAQILLDFRGAAQGGITKGFVERVLVPNYSLKEQEDIVELLSCAESLIFLRKKALQTIQRLKTALFNKTLDDLNDETSDQPLVLLSDVCQITRVSVPVGQRADLKYLGLENIESNTGRYIEASDEKVDVNSTTMYFDSNVVLYSKLRPYLNKVFVPTFEGKCTSELIPLTPNEKINREFLAGFLRSDYVVNSLMTANTGARMPRADPNVLMNLPFRLPSVEIQNKFSKSIEEINEIESLHSKFLLESERSFELLSEKYLKLN